MKKIISGMIFLGLTQASFALCFNGPYAGFETGVVAKKFTTNLQEDSVGTGGPGAGVFPNFILDTNHDNTKNLLFGVVGGYGWNLNPWYIGIEGEIRSDNSNRTNNFNLTASDNSNWPIKTLYHRGTVFGIGPRVGYIFWCGGWMFYGKVSAEYSRDYATYQQVAGLISSPPGTLPVFYSASPNFRSGTFGKWVFSPGFGIERTWGTFAARLEYDFVPGSKISQDVTYTQTGGGTVFVNTDSVETKYQNNMFKLIFVYDFC